MENLSAALGSTIRNLSEGTYENTLKRFRFLFQVGQAHFQIPPNLIHTTFCDYGSLSVPWDGLYSQAAYLIPQFIKDVESDPILAPHSIGLRSRFCNRIVYNFFNKNMGKTYTKSGLGNGRFLEDVNTIAHFAYSGYIGEDTIRDHILQSLTLHDTLLVHQADALLVLFRLAGRTFEAYVDPKVIDRCFKLLQSHQDCRRWFQEKVQVSPFSLQKRSRD